MADSGKRLAGPAQLTATAATKYTTPAATTTVVRNIHFFNADTAARTVTLSVGTDAAGTRLYDAFSIGANSPYDFSGFLVLAAAEIIQAFADTASKVTLTISGIEIT